MANDIGNILMPTIPSGIITSQMTVDATSMNFNSSFTTIATEEMVNSAVEKLDQHVDQLEEDIDYFNNKLEDLDKCNQTNTDKIIAHQAKITALETTVECLKNYIEYLEKRVMEMDDRMNEISNEVAATKEM